MLAIMGCDEEPTNARLAETVSPVSAETQFGIAGKAAGIRPSVVVRDASGVPLGGVLVAFIVSSGGGVVDGSQAETDANGVATVGSWTFGPLPEENRLTASAPALTFSSATFRADALSPGFAVDSIAVGQMHACGIDAADFVYCWGRGADGALGDGTFASRLAPVRVSGGRFRMLAAGLHTCGLTFTGAAQCWGLNSDGQLGDGTSSASGQANANTPRVVAGSLTFQSIVAGNAHTCALTAAGKAYCWGDNSSGQLGDGSLVDRSVPVAVAGNLTFRNLSSSGGFHTCGVTTSGAGYCWGNNGAGAVGDGTTANRTAPVAVAGGLNFQTIFSSVHSCGLTTAGTAYCWGGNSRSQLGDGTTTSRLSPVAVSGGQRFVEMATGTSHTCAIDVNSTAWCWGSNGTGEIGDGTLTNRLLPAVAAPGMGFVSIAASRHTCGVSAGSGTFCWGDNSSGALGNGTTASSSVPVPVRAP